MGYKPTYTDCAVAPPGDNEIEGRMDRDAVDSAVKSEHVAPDIHAAAADLR